MRRIKKILRPLYQKWVFIKKDLREFPWKLRFLFSPVQDNKIVFVCYGGKNYSCNPKYIAQEIIRQNLGYDLVWLLLDVDQQLPEQIRKVKFHSRDAFYELATAKIIISNTKSDLRLFKKKEQYVIQTWHGSYSSKRLEKDAGRNLPSRYIKESKKNSRQTDLFLSNSKVLSQEYRDAFWCKCEILECGFPRNDVLFSWDPKIRTETREKLGIPLDSKIVLYAPTFRDNMSTDAYNVDARGVLDVLKKTGDDWYFLIRMHPNVRSTQSMFQYDEHVLNATNYPDMQELLIAADILITDYSSTVFEFAVLKKPSYIYASDVEQYDAMRGLKKDFFKMPYPINRTNDELLEQLKNYTDQVGQDAAKRFMEYFGGIDKGDASEQVVAHIRNIIEGTVESV